MANRHIVELDAFMRQWFSAKPGVQMGNVVNLNKFRKRKAKAERSVGAEVNRQVHGRTKAERAREELQKRQLTRHVDGAKLESQIDAPEAADSEGPKSTSLD